MNNRTRTRAIFLAAAAICVGAPGCESNAPVGRASVALHKASSCADLEAMLKADAILQMNAAIDQQIRAYDNVSRGLSWGAEEGDSVEFAGTGGASGGDLTPPSANGADPPAHSDTNIQVEGVDEADVVKTDGNYIYLVHGGGFFILDAWPASELSVGASLPIEGQPIEMYVAGDKAVVYSMVPADKVLAEAGQKPRQPFCGAWGCAGTGWEQVDYAGGYGPSMTKVTVLSLAGAAASVIKEHYFEGTYVSSRRVSSHVRTVLSGGYGPEDIAYWPMVPWSDDVDVVGSLEAQRAANVAIITRSTLSDWLPRRFSRAGGGLEAVSSSCEDYYVPTPGTTQYGLTQIQAIDLGALDQPPAHTSIFGTADTVYSNAESLILAARSWDDPWMFEETDQPVSTTMTHLHKFDVGTDPARPRLSASGSVPGTLHNQFSIDEKDGFVRVSTTDTLASANSWVTQNDVFVVAQAGGQLSIVGSLVGLAPGETIQSTRFVGDRGYVVTFRQTDPLFVIDLSTPKSPALVGAIEIPGFSEYMHPLDDTHLLTVGQGGDEFGTDGTLTLQIFDVKNGASPVLSHKYVFPGYGDSEAESNHKAFTYYPTLGMLALPYQSYATDFRSTLELFRIDASNGITPAGTIEHTKFFDQPTGYCGGYYGSGVRRGLFIEDYVYSISYGGVRVNAVADLSEVASLALPAPTYDDCVYY